MPTLLARPALSPVPTPTSAVTSFGPSPESPPIDPMYGLRLSPDGRWLARPGPGYLVVRDLTGTKQITMPSSDIGAWSDDGRWVALTDIGTQTKSLADLDTGAAIPLRLDDAHALWRLSAIFGPHELLLRRYDPRGDQNPSPANEYATVDPRDGRVLRRYTVDFHGPTAEGHLIAWTTEDYARWAGGPREVIIANLDSGRITGRYPLPADDHRVQWSALRVAGDAVVLVRTPRPGDASAPDDPVQLFNLDPVTGARQATCTLPPHTYFMLRG